MRTTRGAAARRSRFFQNRGGAQVPAPEYSWTPVGGPVRPPPPFAQAVHTRPKLVQPGAGGVAVLTAPFPTPSVPLGVSAGPDCHRLAGPQGGAGHRRGNPGHLQRVLSPSLYKASTPAPT